MRQKNAQSGVASTNYDERANFVSKPLLAAVVRTAYFCSRRERVGEDLSTWFTRLTALLGSLSSSKAYFLGVKGVGVNETIGSNSAPPQVQFSVDHRFARNSRLSSMVFIYNATQVGKSFPDLSIQASLLQRGRTVNTEPGEVSRLDANCRRRRSVTQIYSAGRIRFTSDRYRRIQKDYRNPTYQSHD